MTGAKNTHIIDVIPKLGALQPREGSRVQWHHAMPQTLCGIVHVVLAAATLCDFASLILI